MSSVSKAPVSIGRDFTSWPAIFAGTSQTVAAGGSSQQSGAIGEDTTILQVFSTVDCFLAFGANPTALDNGTSMFLPAGVMAYYGVQPGTKVACIKQEDSDDGLLYMTEGA